MSPVFPTAYLLPTESRSLKDLFWVPMFLRVVYRIIAQGRLPDYMSKHGFIFVTASPVRPEHLKRLGLIPLENL